MISPPEDWPRPSPAPPPRLPDWPERLDDYLRRRQNEPFAWGQNDCACLALGAIEAMTGARLYSPDYSTELGAVRAARELIRYEPAPAPGQPWHKDHFWLQALPPVFGFLPCQPLLARRGDLALVRLPEMPAACLGVVVGERIAGPGPAGLRFADLQKALAAWHT